MGDQYIDIWRKRACFSYFSFVFGWEYHRVEELTLTLSDFLCPYGIPSIIEAFNHRFDPMASSVSLQLQSFRCENVRLGRLRSCINNLITITIRFDIVEKFILIATCESNVDRYRSLENLPDFSAEQ